MTERTCTVCERLFSVQRMGQRVCSIVCARKVPVIAKKAEREKTKSRKDAVKTKPQLVKAAQIVINKYVRLRDAGKPCISCQKPYNPAPNSWDAGHFRSVGSSPHLRFVEENINGQCKHCNLYLAGNVVAYRAGLIDRIGLHSVEAIERDQALRKYTREGLVELAKHYNAETKKLKATK